MEVPVSVAYGLYSERESIPRWMTFISSVKVICLFLNIETPSFWCVDVVVLVLQVLKDKSDLSRWTLKYSAFGQNLEYSWLAKNLQARVASTLFVIGFLLQEVYVRRL